MSSDRTDRSTAPAPRLILIGPRPTATQVAGQSIGFDSLIEGVRALGVDPVVVDIAGSETNRAGGWSARRGLEYIGILWRYLRAIAGRPGTVYITIARSPHGFIRDVCMVLLARLFRHRLIGHVKGGDYGVFYDSQPASLRWLIRFTLRRFERILVLGELLRDMFAFDPALNERVHVVANGLPFTAATPDEGKSLPAPDAPVRARILFLSNLIESKGYFEVLEAARYLVHERDLPVEVHFCGTFQANRADDVRVRTAEQARELFETFVRDHGLARYVTFKGVVGGAEKIDELRAAHFFVLPTHYICEGQPISIIEAMAYGCVVLSTAFRAIPEVVQSGVSGLLFAPGDRAGPGRALGDLIEDPARFTAMSGAAVARFHAHFTREAHLARLLPHLLDPARIP